MTALAVAAVVGGAVVAALGAGVAMVGLPLAATAAAGAAAGVVLALASVAGQGRHRRTALLATGCGTTAGLVLTAVAAPPSAALILIASLLCLVAGEVVVGRALDGVDPEEILARQSRGRHVGRSVLAGDQRGATLGPARLPGQPPARRTGHLPLQCSGFPLLLGRDLLGLRRARTRTAVACVVGVAAAGLLLTAPPGGVPAVLGALVLYACTNSWTTGLAAHVDNADGSGLTPHSARRVFVGHLRAPVLVAAAVTAVAALLLGVTAPGALALGAALACWA